VAAGMADSKVPDAQAGHEKALTTALAGLSGANLVYESFGMLASLLACSNEMMVIDNDILASVLRAVRGIEVTSETMAADAIEDAVVGEGHFLAAEQTLAVMETEYIYPTVGDRLSPDDWHDQGATDAWQRARLRVQDMLSRHYPAHIEPERDDLIRERFDIRLSREDMSPTSRRW
jgi:trimethylamine--corrinoid protein Co-methyltransferase